MQYPNPFSLRNSSVAFSRQNGLSVQSAIDTTFLDTAHYDAECSFPNGFEELNKLAITQVGGLRPFIMADGKLKTQEFTVEAVVTLRQELLLRQLYSATIHPGYVDLRFPVVFMWGHPDSPSQIKCYLSEYEAPESVDYKSAEILDVKLTLRAI